MLCSILFAIGLTTASCVAPTPVPAPARDHAAEVLVEQESRRDAEVEAALAKRAKLYRGLGECSDCGKLNTVPFGKE
jgi:hypothetical protein